MPSNLTEKQQHCVSSPPHPEVIWHVMCQAPPWCRLPLCSEQPSCGKFEESQVK